MQAAAKSAFVLVAGGLGERLGYSGIKLALPVNQLTQGSFLKMYADWILAIQVSHGSQPGSLLRMSLYTRQVLTNSGPLKLCAMANAHVIRPLRSRPRRINN